MATSAPACCPLLVVRSCLPAPIGELGTRVAGDSWDVFLSFLGVVGFCLLFFIICFVCVCFCCAFLFVCFG